MLFINAKCVYRIISENNLLGVGLNTILRHLKNSGRSR
ncbi:IS1-like element transposase, partial [Escherichia coli]